MSILSIVDWYSRLVEDADMVESKMDGKKYMASRVATTWRRNLMRGE